MIVLSIDCSHLVFGLFGHCKVHRSRYSYGNTEVTIRELLGQTPISCPSRMDIAGALLFAIITIEPANRILR